MGASGAPYREYTPPTVSPRSMLKSYVVPNSEEPASVTTAHICEVAGDVAGSVFGRKHAVGSWSAAGGAGGALAVGPVGGGGGVVDGRGGGGVVDGRGGGGSVGCSHGLSGPESGEGDGVLGGGVDGGGLTGTGVGAGIGGGGGSSHGLS